MEEAQSAADDLGVARLALAAALAEGDVGLAYRSVLALMGDGVGMAVVLEEVLAPIQRASGTRWEAGEVSVPEEHATTAAVATLVAMLAGAFDQPPEADLVVVACAEGEDHTLPARMATALLAYEGYRTVDLGGSVPAEDLTDYLGSVAADALVVSCTRPANLLGARACVAAGHRAGVPVAVGGRAFDVDADLWRRVGADARVARLSDLSELLATWHPDPASAEASAANVGGEAAALRDSREAVSVAVSTGLGAASGATPPPEVAVAAGGLVDALVAAMTFDVRAVVAEQARWVSRLIAGRNRAVLPAAVLEALAEALPADLPTAVAIVAEARRSAER